MQSIRIPITNVYAEGGYCARVYLGDKQIPVKLILDTGSSVLAVHNENYQPEQDNHLKPTAWVQDIQYGAGGWYGPVVKTSIRLGMDGESVSVSDVPIALTVVQKQNSFFKADGIWGLAYTELDHAFDLTEFLKSEKVEPCNSFPYLLGHHAEDVADYRHFLHSYPQQQIEPYFDCIEDSGTVANQFALLTHRSSIYHPTNKDEADSAHAHELNHGLLIVGKPHHHTDLYQQPVHSVKILHEKYFNVNVVGIQVGESPVIDAPQLAKKDVKGYCTNGIVDSGAFALVLPELLFQQVKQDLIRHNQAFASLLAPFEEYSGKEIGVPLANLNLSDWPDITVLLEGKQGNAVPVIVTPQTYWQVNAPDASQATFKLCTLAGWPNQLILGMPMLNGYYTIFDREDDTIQFAKKCDIAQTTKCTMATSLNINNKQAEV